MEKRRLDRHIDLDPWTLPVVRKRNWDHKQRRNRDNPLPPIPKGLPVHRYVRNIQGPKVMKRTAAMVAAEAASFAGCRHWRPSSTRSTRPPGTANESFVMHLAAETERGRNDRMLFNFIARSSSSAAFPHRRAKERASLPTGRLAPCAPGPPTKPHWQKRYTGCRQQLRLAWAKPGGARSAPQSGVGAPTRG